jgi:SanA protein
MLDKLKRNFWKILFGVLVLFTTTLGINLYIIFSTKSCIFHQITKLPKREYGLVLGTDRLRFNGSTNLHFLNRIEIAAKVFEMGKATHLLISGNTNNHGFNEVLEMKKIILTKGVPESAIELDFAGTTTLESARRARNIFDLQQLVIITDDFHASRAIFLCRHFGIDAIAICPDRDPFGFWSLKYSVREYFARLKAFFDVLIEKNNGKNG